MGTAIRRSPNGSTCWPPYRTTPPMKLSPRVSRMCSSQRNHSRLGVWPPSPPKRRRGRRTIRARNRSRDRRGLASETVSLRSRPTSVPAQLREHERLEELTRRRVGRALQRGRRLAHEPCRQAGVGDEYLGALLDSPVRLREKAGNVVTRWIVSSQPRWSYTAWRSNAESLIRLAITSSQPERAASRRSSCRISATLRIPESSTTSRSIVVRT